MGTPQWDTALILVIDDESAVRRSLRRMLERAGHTVLEASDGRAGLTLFQQHRPELSIVDIIMPEMDGIEVIIEMRRDRPQAKIIAISGGGQTQGLHFLDMAKKLGAVEALAKPFRVKQLLEAVDRALQAAPA